MNNTKNPKISKTKVIIYTDGACKGNPGKGGWGAVLIYGKFIKKLHGGEIETTNNRMEITAAIKALEALKLTCDVEIYTDSKYVQNGIKSWLKNWKKNNWRTANKAPVKNKELWILLDKMAEKHKITWKWVKGHSGDKMNDLADELANKGVAEL